MSKTTYSESLAKDRDKLRVQLRKANEQREALLAALRRFVVVADNEYSDEQAQARAAIAAAEGSAS